MLDGRPPDRRDADGRPRSCRILAVENNPLVLSFVHLGLAEAGYEVDTAADGREALAKIDAREYDLIISDLRMPEVDGLALCRALRARGTDVLRRMLVLSASDALADGAECLPDAGVPALAKPVTLERLRDAVARMLETAAAAELAPA
jgi:CheY-like chemotaxis protein